MVEYKGSKERIFFSAGDIVRVKHRLGDENPHMLIQSVDKTTLPAAGSGLLGVTCIWFNKDWGIERFRFSTKDIEKVT